MTSSRGGGLKKMIVVTEGGRESKKSNFGMTSFVNGPYISEETRLDFKSVLNIIFVHFSYNRLCVRHKLNSTII